MSSNWKIWVSRVFTGIITLALIATSSMKLTHAQKMVDSFTRVGIPDGAVVPIALLELTCLALYLMPRTMVLGAVLLTGYFGGAMVVHIIGGQSIFPLIMIGVMVWGGIYFRVPGIENLMPLRRGDTVESQEAAGARSTIPSRGTSVSRA